MNHNSVTRGTLQLFAFGILAAAMMIGASLIIVKVRPDPAMRVVVTLLPLIPLAGLAWSIIRGIQQVDELQRRIHLDAVTAAFVGTAFVAIIVGQLQHADIGVPEINWSYLWPVQVVLWTISYIAASRRYQ